MKAMISQLFYAKAGREARGCRIEHDIAAAYGLEALYEA